MRMTAGKPGKTSEKIPLEEELASWGRKLLHHARNFGVRVFVHLAALACGGTVAVTTASVMSGLCVYAGLICLVPGNIGVTPAWLAPVGLGLAQTAVLAFFGLPLAQAVFWGGAQAWLQRLLHQRRDMGGEWLALLLLLPVGIRLVADMGSLAPFLFAFSGIFLAGCAIARALFHRRRAAADAAAYAHEPKKVVLHRASLAALNDKISRLPRNTQPVTLSIAASTDNILECMRKDSRDLEPGHRFLHRYLTAVHTVVDKHIRLAREAVITPEGIAALEKSGEMLARLDAAFAREHARLLKNDVTDFSADLEVLDTLLKMDGR